MVIESVAQGLKVGLARRQIRAEEPKTLDHSLHILQAQARAEEDERQAERLRGRAFGQNTERRRERPMSLEGMVAEGTSYQQSSFRGMIPCTMCSKLKEKGLKLKEGCLTKARGTAKEG